MVAHMNAEALAQTIASGEAWYFSRSRGALWKKGETSGHVQRVVEMRIDCDQDAVVIKVEQAGGACHTGRRSCFYRAVPLGKAGAVTLNSATSACSIRTRCIQAMIRSSLDPPAARTNGSDRVSLRPQLDERKTRKKGMRRCPCANQSRSGFKTLVALHMNVVAGQA